jgi:hypothetical protein
VDAPSGKTSGHSYSSINADQLSKVEALKYLSLIMLLMYLARFTEPDILFALRVLATRTMAHSTSNMLKENSLKQFQLYLERTFVKRFAFEKDKDRTLEMFM